MSPVEYWVRKGLFASLAATALGAFVGLEGCSTNGSLGSNDEPVEWLVVGTQRGDDILYDIAEYSAFDADVAGLEAHPSTHEWAYIEEVNEEIQGYSTYTYVLAGRGEGDEPYMQRYRRLICAVESIANKRAQAASSKGREANIFIIPVSKNSERAVPDYELSKVLLGSIVSQVPRRWDNAPGPFLITLLGPVDQPNKISDITDVLFVDMSRVHDGAFSEFVREYMRTIQESAIDGIVELKSLRLSLLNVILYLNAGISLFPVAQAQIRKAGVLVLPQELPRNHDPVREVPLLADPGADNCLRPKRSPPSASK